MIKKTISPLLRIIFLFYIFIIPKRIKFGNLENLDFKKADFINYKKIKLLIFKNDFIKNNSEQVINNFDFINYSIKIGGKKGIEISKKNIFEWHKVNRLKINKLWDSETIANRTLNLIYNYEYINSISSVKEENKLRKIIINNINRLNFELRLKNTINLTFLELKAYILINILLDKKNLNYEKIFNKIIENQLDRLSVHKSYNLLEQSKCINHISEIINILLRFKRKVPEIIFVTRLKMITALSQYFHKDDSIALFNGANNSYIKAMLIVLKEESNLRKIEYPKEENGLFFYEDKNKKIFLDVIQPSKSLLSKKLSASTLAIEFSSFKEKIITNCGALEKFGGNAGYLRYTAAHSAIILNNTNISEIRDNQPHLKFPQTVNFKKNYSNNSIICEGSHNGYVKNYKKIIKRKIFFNDKDGNLYGEDHIISSILPAILPTVGKLVDKLFPDEEANKVEGAGDALQRSW